MALYVNQRFTCTLRAVKSKVIFEYVTVELDMKKHRNIIVSCVYRTPGSDIDKLCESIEQLFTEVMPSKYIFVCDVFIV